jgi:hypothetical protein
LKVRENKSVAIDDLSGFNRKRRGEHGPGVNAGVKLAVLAAWVSARRQII